MTTQKIYVKFVKLSPNAIIPNQTIIPNQRSPESIFNLYSAYDYIIPTRGKVTVRTDIQTVVPNDYYQYINPNKPFLSVEESFLPGVVVLLNLYEEDFVVKRGDCIAQLSFGKISTGYSHDWRRGKPPDEVEFIENFCRQYFMQQAKQRKAKK